MGAQVGPPEHCEMTSNCNTGSDEGWASASGPRHVFELKVYPGIALTRPLARLVKLSESR